MSIIDYFRKISGAEIYRETCDIIKQHRLYYRVEAVVPTEDPKEQEDRHKLKRKSFYMSGFANQDWFVQLTYCPVEFKFIPIKMKICTSSEINLNEQGVNCNANGVHHFSYHKEYSLSDWKAVKAKLINAIEFASKTPQFLEGVWGDWLSGEEDKNLIHYEAANKPFKPTKKPLKLNIKKGPKTIKENNDERPE